jgi:hypothetical protein
MEESKWICERCGREYDLEKGDGWITLVEDEESHLMDKLILSLSHYERVCYECAGELYEIVEKCNRDCLQFDRL